MIFLNFKELTESFSASPNVPKSANEIIFSFSEKMTWCSEFGSNRFVGVDIFLQIFSPLVGGGVEGGRNLQIFSKKLWAMSPTKMFCKTEKSIRTPPIRWAHMNDILKGRCLRIGFFILFVISSEPQHQKHPISNLIIRRYWLQNSVLYTGCSF